MTTIACNKEALYGDLQFTQPSNGHKFKGKSKVFKVKAHPDVYHEDFIVGFCGTAVDIVTVISYFTMPDMFDKPPKVKDMTGLVLTASQQIFLLEDYTKWLAVDAKYFAIGSGAQYALGAMAEGAHPRDAVKIAMKHDAFTGMGIRGFEL